VELLNQNEDLAGTEGCEPCARPPWADGACVEKDQAETELWRELALDALEVIHDAPSRIASISSVANDGLGCCSICLTGGQGSDSSCTTARLRLIASSVPMRQQNAMELRMAMVLV
jgi:hypothetical protein